MNKKYKGYVVSSYTISVDTDQQGMIHIKRWRVSQIESESSQIKRILRDGFQTEEEATAYADKLYNQNH